MRAAIAWLRRIVLRFGADIVRGVRRVGPGQVPENACLRRPQPSAGRRRGGRRGGPCLPIAEAAAVLVRLGESVGLIRPFGRAGRHEHDIERFDAAIGQRLARKRHAEDDNEVRKDREEDRDAETVSGSDIGRGGERVQRSVRTARRLLRQDNLHIGRVAGSKHTASREPPAGFAPASGPVAGGVAASVGAPASGPVAGGVADSVGAPASGPVAGGATASVGAPASGLRPGAAVESASALRDTAGDAGWNQRAARRASMVCISVPAMSVSNAASISRTQVGLVTLISVR